LHRWAQIGVAGGVVSVNLSARQLASPDLVGNVVGAMAAAGIEPGQLSFEITESVLMDDVDFSIEILRALKDVGVGLAIDDFGTGYSSLSYLKRLPLDAIKLDRAFVQNLDESTVDQQIVGAVVQMARALGMTVVAEGVETEGQRARLRELGCHVLQGYYFARPMPAEEMSAMLAAQRDGRS
jgi:EAL domain-containing protein (putative c-di-GMP-specific phosphodiesterase class I)